MPHWNPTWLSKYHLLWVHHTSVPLQVLFLLPELSSNTHAYPFHQQTFLFSDHLLCETCPHLCPFSVHYFVVFFFLCTTIKIFLCTTIKKISPGISLEGLMLKLKLQYFGHLMRRVDSLEKTDAGKDCRQEEKGTTEDEMAGRHHWLNGCEFEWTPGVGDGQGGLPCCDSWRRRESDTERLNWTNKNFITLSLFFPDKLKAGISPLFIIISPGSKWYLEHKRNTIY